MQASEEIKMAEGEERKRGEKSLKIFSWSLLRLQDFILFLLCIVLCHISRLFYVNEALSLVKEVVVRIYRSLLMQFYVPF